MKTLMMITAVAIALAGCDRQNEEKSHVSTADGSPVVAPCRYYADLTLTDVVVRVNGGALTKGEIERQIALRLALAKRRFKDLTGSREAQMRRNMVLSCDRQFIKQELLRAFALSNRVTVTESDRVPMRARIVEQYARGETYGRLVKQLTPEERGALGDSVDREIWTEKGRAALVSKHFKPIDASEVSRRRSYFEKYNELANRALTKTWQEASNVWQRASAGYPFEQLVEHYSDGKVEHVSADAVWGDIKASDYADDPGLLKMLSMLKEGWISPPFEGDNGLLIVKMLKITPADPANGIPEPFYRLSRIHFDLPEVWIPETDEELMADIKKIHEREAFNEGMSELVGAAVIEYPCGTNLFPKASAPANIPASVRTRLPQGPNIKEGK